MKPRSTSPLAGGWKRQAAGFALIAAISILVLLSLLGAYLGRIAVSSQMGSAQDIQGSRAYQAARAGMEWGLYQVLDPTNALGLQMPACPAATTLAIEGFSVTVSCVQSAAYIEATRTTVVYSLAAIASLGTVGTPGYVERNIQSNVVKCRDPDNPLPGHACS